MREVIDKDGNKLVAFIEGSEGQLLADPAFLPLTHALVVAQQVDKVLMVFNKYRNYWELPGGVIDAGESASQCAVRELQEESGQRVTELRFLGLMQIYLAKGQKTEYGALFAGQLSPWSPFKENEEIAQVKLWDRQEKIGVVAEIDAALAAAFSS